MITVCKISNNIKLYKFKKLCGKYKVFVTVLILPPAYLIFKDIEYFILATLSDKG